MHNKFKSEYFAITSTKRVALFQTSLKLVRQEARAKLSNNEYNIQHSMEQTIYVKRVL